MNFILRSISLRLFLVSSLAMLLISGCSDFAVNSQTKTSQSQKETKKMNKKLKNLKELQWKNRIILIKESEKETLQTLRDDIDAIKDRDLVWFVVTKEKIETNYKGELAEDFAEHLNEKYFKESDAKVLLIGKDGTIKSKDAEFDLKDYFKQIDAMPMRRREIREKNQ